MAIKSTTMIFNNTKIKNFTKPEFPKGELKLAHPQLIITLDLLRDFIGWAIHPSPVKGALARLDGSKTSQHYAVYRLSTGIDVFIDTDPFEALIKILHSKLFNRVGIYFDTRYDSKHHVMFHLDLKDQSLLWYRDEYGYVYSSEKDFYHKLLCKFQQEVLRNMN